MKQKTESADFYSEKLQLVFTSLPDRCTLSKLRLGIFN